MGTKEIINTVAHRPWPVPKKKWKFYQEWNGTIFLHWQVDLAGLQKFVPPQFEIDLFDGKPWISLVAFTVQDMRPHYFPNIFSFLDFHEVNFRTYVHVRGKTGVYFLSIEGSKRISCNLAKMATQLPYRYSEMERTGNAFLSRNSQYGEHMDLQYGIGETLEKKEIDVWLTERYALFQDSNNSMHKFEVHHIAWPLFRLQIKKIALHYPRFEKLVGHPPNRTHYSPGVAALVWGKDE